MTVQVEKNRLLSLKGDQHNPDSWGFLCIRGRATQEIFENPLRLLHPLRRVDERGEGRWERCSWEDAYSLIVDAIQHTQLERVGLWRGHGIGTTGPVGTTLVNRFGLLGGFQQWSSSIVCWAMGAYGLRLTGKLKIHSKEDMAQVILAEGLQDQELIEHHTLGFVPFADHIWACRPEWASAIIGQLGIAGGGLDQRHGASPGSTGLADLLADVTPKMSAEVAIPNRMASINEAMTRGQLDVLLLFGTNMLSSFADANEEEYMNAQLWIHPLDAHQRHIANETSVVIVNQRGYFEASAHVTEDILPGVVWMRDGWAGVNRVTSGAPIVSLCIGFLANQQNG